ncbi:hypothetical protein Nepgr_026629 [Nepenthes gracilis]|uniref:Uncharacterized protein n=1 Tax=Nepenthes gracilis TaxID=150966 RepID=A0AAD3TA37_NEPGR|nr:hypothetical protein Nepgr_026629 [Nepenthes gracilis]
MMLERLLLFLDSDGCALAWACEWRGGLAVDGSSGSLRAGPLQTKPVATTAETGIHQCNAIPAIFLFEDIQFDSLKLGLSCTRYLAGNLVCGDMLQLHIDDARLVCGAEGVGVGNSCVRLAESDSYLFDVAEPMME